MNDLELGKKRAEELGLELIFKAYEIKTYLADDIHRLLGEGVEVQGSQFSLDGGTGNMGWCCDEEPMSTDTHKALLIGIRSIFQESEARKLLREICSQLANNDFYLFKQDDPKTVRNLFEKAKRLLSEVEK